MLLLFRNMETQPVGFVFSARRGNIVDVVLLEAPSIHIAGLRFLKQPNESFKYGTGAFDSTNPAEEPAPDLRLHPGILSST